MNKHNTVIGLGFGDEGKGLVTEYLCQEFERFGKPIVARFSGGQQAGHTVVKRDVRHVFSNLGSGSLNGNDTYWSKYCTFDPVGFMNEYQIFIDKHNTVNTYVALEKGRHVQRVLTSPIFYIDERSPVTTPFEIMHNQMHRGTDGTCGVGVGETFKREESFYSITFGDLYNKYVLKTKIDILRKLHPEKNGVKIALALDYFFYVADCITKNDKIVKTVGIPKHYDRVIFESSQGLMLDQNIGFFPHCTRSNTDLTNILKMGEDPGDIWLVTRAYVTRHGNGPMPNEGLPHNIASNPLETNINNEYQGEFRRALLDLNLLEYAYQKNPTLSSHRFSTNLVVTCLDHITDDLRLTYNGKIHSFLNTDEFALAIGRVLKLNNVYVSKSDKSEHIVKLTDNATSKCYYRSTENEFIF